MFIAYLEQKCEGCDYTIGCGLEVIGLEATTLEEAKKELKEKIIGKWNEEDKIFDEGEYVFEKALKTATIYDVSNICSVPIEEWYEEAIENEIKVKENKTEEDEKKELQRLKNKYE